MTLLSFIKTATYRSHFFGTVRFIKPGPPEAKAFV
jgi:hypothetical protein